MTAPISAEVIAKLRALRQIQKVSARQLADQVTALGYEVSGSVIANYESGKKATLPVDFLVLAAKALGTTAEALLTEPVRCPSCMGEPPAGFTCNTCGAAAEMDGASS